jgi:hypothetical protein
MKNLFKKTYPTFKDQIWIIDNQLTPELCRHMIGKFEHDIENQNEGTTGMGRAPLVKQSEDLMVSRLEHWRPEDKQLQESLGRALVNYQNRMIKLCKHYPIQKLEDTGYQIQRTVPGGFYTWHTDAADTRELTFIWYFNDIKHGGYTEFVDGTRVQPKAGRMVIFPATSAFVHRGVAPESEIKYLCTGWLYRGFTGDPKIPGEWKEHWRPIEEEIDHNRDGACADPLPLQESEDFEENLTLQ